jgi:hypothetical protein
MGNVRSGAQIYGVGVTKGFLGEDTKYTIIVILSAAFRAEITHVCYDKEMDTLFSFSRLFPTILTFSDQSCCYYAQALASGRFLYYLATYPFCNSIAWREASVV